MGILSRKPPLEKEWEALRKRETAFLARRAEKQDTFLNQLLAEKVPAGLQDTLDKGFCKAFHLLFEKGTGLIEKTYDREKLEQDYQVAQYANDLQKTRKSLRTFSKKAGATGTRSVLLSGASGIGMGLLGVGLPDIPLFTGMLLRTVYEIALHYGYHYDTPEEQYCILLLIQTAVSHGMALEEQNEQLDQFFYFPVLPEDYDREAQIRQTAGALSKELLYMKFLQGIPLVGAIGGSYDVVYMKQVSDYAKLKYKRRFLVDQGAADTEA